MLLDLFTGIAFLAKHAWPFIREWLFKSRSFKSWLKSHAAQLFYFALICLMLFVCYHLFLAATEAHALRRSSEKQLEQISLKYNNLLESTSGSRKIIDSQRLLIRKQTAMLSIYQDWMSACGMDYADLEAEPYPTCAHNVRMPTKKPKARPSLRKNSVKANPVNRDPVPATYDKSREKDEKIRRRVQDIWSQK